MFFRDEESGATAGFPLRGMVELKCGTIELQGLARWRCTFRWKRGALQREQVVPELNNAPPNQNCGNKKKDRRRDERGTVIVFPNPVHGIARSTFNLLVFHFRFTRHQNVNFNISTRAEISMCSSPTMKFSAVLAGWVGADGAFAGGFVSAVFPRAGPLSFSFRTYRVRIM